MCPDFCHVENFGRDGYVNWGMSMFPTVLCIRFYHDVPNVHVGNVGISDTAICCSSHSMCARRFKQGAATSTYVALHPNMKGISGKFFADCNEEPTTTYTKLGGDEEAAKKLFATADEWTSKTADA